MGFTKFVGKVWLANFVLGVGTALILTGLKAVLAAQTPPPKNDVPDDVKALLDDLLEKE